jgi:hypothetical protein
LSKMLGWDVPIRRGLEPRPSRPSRCGVW